MNYKKFGWTLGWHFPDTSTVLSNVFEDHEDCRQKLSQSMLNGRHTRYNRIKQTVSSDSSSIFCHAYEYDSYETTYVYNNQVIYDVVLPLNDTYVFVSVF